MKIKFLKFSDKDFENSLKKRLEFDSSNNEQIMQVANDILIKIKKEGDSALIDLTKQFDALEVDRSSDLEISQQDINIAFDNIGLEQKKALEAAASRIFDYHEKQKTESWSYEDSEGSLFGQKVTPLDKVGLYVPGGKAAYPSSVLMNAIPAKVAGVKELIMVVPTPNGERNDLVLAAAKVAKVDRIFTIGGAQAIGALAYGTKTIPKVDKIVGPGNAYVAEAKRRVFGTVGIDMIAGPSEILIISDKNSNPDWIAMDLFSQAEHDELAQSILISDDEEFFRKVKLSIDNLIKNMPRKNIIETSLTNRGIFILVENLSEAAEVSNLIAPEHLELAVDSPKKLLEKIKHAGAIFIGRNTCEAVGDYCAGPNHVLPTSGTARFSSPLGVYDFQKKSSLIALSENSASRLGKIASTLAKGEGLYAHGLSAEYRIKK
jgi:histidinol dehydrogenase